MDQKCSVPPCGISAASGDDRQFEQI
jgi:hypothetical protein